MSSRERLVRMIDAKEFNPTDYSSESSTVTPCKPPPCGAPPPPCGVPPPCRKPPPCNVPKPIPEPCRPRPPCDCRRPYSRTEVGVERKRAK